MRDLDVVKIGGSVLFGREDKFRTNTVDNIFRKLGSQTEDVKSLHSYHNYADIKGS